MSETPKPKYEPLPEYRDEPEVDRVLSDGSREELMRLSLALGQSWPDWQYAQAICLRLAEHADAGVRANACLALSYIAYAHRKLDKEPVERVLLRELQVQKQYRWSVEEAISDINHYMGWNLGRTH
jgi:hypothetical protein